MRKAVMNSMLISTLPRFRSHWIEQSWIWCAVLQVVLLADQPPAKLAPQSTPAKTAQTVAATSGSPIEQVALASVRAHFGTQRLRVMGDWAIDDDEAVQLQKIFAAAQSAYASIVPGPDEGRQRKAVGLELTAELEAFLQQHPVSSWAPDICFQLGRMCQLRSGYSKAIHYYARAWEMTKDSEQNPAHQIALDAAGPLSKLLALTGRLEELDALQLEARARGKVPPSSDWLWASEMAAFARKHPTDSYKCGLYCLDQLGRLTQPDKYRPADVL